jgi:hypothetical protein
MKKYTYKVETFYRTTIERFMVVKKTPKQVVYLSDSWNKGVFKETRSNIEGKYENFFDSWEEAHAFLVDRAEKSVENKKQRLHEEKSKLGQIKTMKES